MFNEESFSKRRIASVYKLFAKLNKRQRSAVLEAGDSSHGPNKGCINFFIKAVDPKGSTSTPGGAGQVN